jgi:hypothetical protein
MKTFEYKVVNYTQGGVDYLNDVGKEGWQLIGWDEKMGYVFIREGGFESLPDIISEEVAKGLKTNKPENFYGTSISDLEELEEKDITLYGMLIHQLKVLTEESRKRYNSTDPSRVTLIWTMKELNRIISEYDSI